MISFEASSDDFKRGLACHVRCEATAHPARDQVETMGWKRNLAHTIPDFISILWMCVVTLHAIMADVQAVCVSSACELRRSQENCEGFRKFGIDLL